MNVCRPCPAASVRARAGRLGAALATALAAAGPAAAAGPSVLVETAAAEQRTLSETVTAYGVLEPDPDQIIAVSIPRAGLISRVWVELGQRVEAGARLLEIATAPDALMRFQQAQSAVDFAHRAAAREQHLLAEQLSTRAQVETARRALRDAKATLAALRKKGMDQHAEIVRAPVDGVVARIDVQQGQRVQADTTTLLLADQQALIARLGVEPEDLHRIRPGATVHIQDVFDDSISFSGTARQVHAKIDPLTKLVDVLVAVPAEHTARMVLGSALAARITLADVSATAVPRKAVLRGERGAYVFTLDSGRAHRIDVETGVSQGEWIEVEGAIAPGAPVIVRGNYGLGDGMAVRTPAR